MTSGLRKAHKITWILLLIAVPVLIMFSIHSIKEPLLTDNDVLLSEKISGQRTVLENDTFYISIKEQNSSNALQIILKKPLKTASSIVYSLTPSNGDGTYLGTLSKKGIYQFEVDKSTRSIRIYDEIKKNNIINITL
ncbi:hypothetical protein [uncultured Aquimarina sp.]|uniref:hypothetical protein n=1 Tax=uncultured Aquimarina sp. TaxID=575652 RepID=UPI00263A33B4|nr:hypothetical protein [uncultured Aquimarina sp.]